MVLENDSQRNKRINKTECLQRKKRRANFSHGQLRTRQGPGLASEGSSSLSLAPNTSTAMTVRRGCHFCSPGWRELCCSRGCWCPGRGNCWNCPRRRCHWPHQTVCSPAAWWAAHPRPRTPLPSEWALPPSSHPAGDRKGRKHYPHNPGVLRRGTRWLSTPHRNCGRHWGTTPPLFCQLQAQISTGT